MSGGNKEQQPAIPAHWVWTTVGECVFDIRKGIAVSTGTSGAELPVTRIESIRNRRLDPVRFGVTVVEKEQDIERFRYRTGDIVFSNINDARRIGSTALYTGSPDVLLHGINLLRLRIGHDLLLPRFLFWYMQTPFFRSEVRRRAVPSVAQLVVSQAALSDIPVPLPPYDEQERIADRLDEVAVVLNRSQRRLRVAGSLLRQMEQSVLAAATSGRLTADIHEMVGAVPDDVVVPDDPESPPEPATALEYLPSDHIAVWQAVRLKDVLQDGGLFDGPFGALLKRSDMSEEGDVRVIDEDNIGVMEFDDTKKLYISREKYASLAAHTVYAGDIVFCSTVEHGVRACILPEGIGPAIVRMNCFCIRPDETLLRRDHLLIQLCGACCEAQLLAFADESGRPTVSLAQVRSLRVQLCPADEADEIVHRITVLWGVLKRLEQRHRQTTTYLETVETAALAKGYRGELVESSREETGRAVVARLQELRTGGTGHHR